MPVYTAFYYINYYMVVELMTKLSLKTKVILGVAVLILASLLYAWYSPSSNTGTVTLAPTNKVVATMPTKEVKSAPLKIYDKKEVAKHLKVSDEVLTSPTKEITTVADVKPSPAGVTVTCVTDTATGISSVYQEVKPMSLFGLAKEFRVGAGAGYTIKGTPTIDLHAEYTFVRVGKLYGSIRGELEARNVTKVGDSPVDGKGTLNLEYRP